MRYLSFIVLSVLLTFLLFQGNKSRHFYMLPKSAISFLPFKDLLERREFGKHYREIKSEHLESLSDSAKIIIYSTAVSNWFAYYKEFTKPLFQTHQDLLNVPLYLHHLERQSDTLLFSYFPKTSYPAPEEYIHYYSTAVYFKNRIPVQISHGCGRMDYVAYQIKGKDIDTIDLWKIDSANVHEIISETSGPYCSFLKEWFGSNSTQ